MNKYVEIVPSVCTLYSCQLQLSAERSLSRAPRRAGEWRKGWQLEMINPAKRRRTNLDNIETDPKTPDALLLLSVLSGINSGKKLAFPSSFPIYFLSICHLTLTEFLSIHIFLQFKTSYLTERPYCQAVYSFIIIHVLSNGLRRTNLKPVLIGLPIFAPILYLFHSISCTCFIPSRVPVSFHLNGFFASH